MDNDKKNCCIKLSYKLAILLSQNPNVNVNKNNILRTPIILARRSFNSKALLDIKK